MSKFQIGEVVIAECISDAQFNGTEMIIKGLFNFWGDQCYYTDFPVGDDRGWSEKALRKLPDGNTVTEWKDCIFKPTEVTA